MRGSDWLKGIVELLEEMVDYKAYLSDKHVYVWGTGNSSLMYREGFNRESDLEIYGYAVNDSSKWGSIFCGKRVYSPNEVADDSKAFVLICSLQPWVYKEVSKQLDKLGVENYYADRVVLGLHKDEIMKVYESLYDDKSRKIYTGILNSRVRCDYPDEEYSSFNPNFVNSVFKKIDEKDIFVDCGAFVGDSIERYIWNHCGTFDKIYGFEPDSSNYNAMSIRVDRLKKEWNLTEESIVLLPYGVSNESSIAFVHKNSVQGLSSSLVEKESEGAEKCQIVSIDDYFLNSGLKYSFLKADVEGYEYRLLDGAQKSIEEYSPRLAICMYHNATDLYSIPMKIKEMDSDYNIMIRHHSVQFFDTVCYAWK